MNTKYGLPCAPGLIVVAMMTVAASGPAEAQLIAPGPYYAWPSWDQKLPASTRFIVLSNWNNEAVLDRETGLVWEQSPSTVQREWEHAHTSCLAKTVDNRRGWRLPTIQELASLIDPSQSDPALPAGHPFSDVQLGTAYWSASTDAGRATNAWWASFQSDGAINVTDKTEDFPAWCVRGGQGVDPQ